MKPSAPTPVVVLAAATTVAVVRQNGHIGWLLLRAVSTLTAGSVVFLQRQVRRFAAVGERG